MWEIWERVTSKETSVTTILILSGVYALLNAPKAAKEVAEAGLKLIELLKAWRAYRNDSQGNS